MKIFIHAMVAAASLALLSGCVGYAPYPPAPYAVQQPVAAPYGGYNYGGYNYGVYPIAPVPIFRGGWGYGGGGGFRGYGGFRHHH